MHIMRTRRGARKRNRDRIAGPADEVDTGIWEFSLCFRGSLRRSGQDDTPMNQSVG